MMCQWFRSQQGREMKGLIFLYLLTLGSLAVTVLLFSSNDGMENNLPTMRRQPLKQFCKGCKKLIKDVTEMYSRTWWKQQQHRKKFGSLLKKQCNGLEDAILTRVNSPMSKSLVKIIPPENPFSNKTWDTCSVVGNGGILYDSHCGKKIDSADFVIRCNLPPLHGDFKTHVGNKSSFVTANPSIFREMKTQANYTQGLAKRIKPHGDAMIAIPGQNRLVFKTINFLKGIKSPSHPVFLNPVYMSKLTQFWRSRGVKAARISSGLFMVSMALEICQNVNVYGFWPFNVHPFGLYFLPHHYYDNRSPKNFHKMPAEFQNLLQLHIQGVIRLHLGTCK